MSDLVTRQQLHRLDLYRHVYRPLGVEYQIAFTLPSGADRILGVSLSRVHKDFTTHERDVLNAARPYLIQMYRNALLCSRLVAEADVGISPRSLEALGLTRRQAEVLVLITGGRSAAQAAAALGIATRTVHKHLEGSYRTLKVSSRAEALRVASAAAYARRT
jgi:DNA-binding CsgD family transcriptional regulator